MYPVLIPYLRIGAGNKVLSSRLPVLSGFVFLLRAWNRELGANSVRTSLSRTFRHDSPAGLSPAARSTLSSKFELRATSCELRANRNFGLFEARGLWPAALYLSSGNSVKDPGL